MFASAMSSGDSGSRFNDIPRSHPEKSLQQGKRRFSVHWRTRLSELSSECNVRFHIPSHLNRRAQGAIRLLLPVPILDLGEVERDLIHRRGTTGLRSTGCKGRDQQIREIDFLKQLFVPLLLAARNSLKRRSSVMPPCPSFSCLASNQAFSSCREFLEQGKCRLSTHWWRGLSEVRTECNNRHYRSMFFLIFARERLTKSLFWILVTS